MDLKLILLPLFVLAFLIPVIVALVMIPNRLGRTPWQRNLQRLFGLVAGIGLVAAIVAYSDKYPDRISFDASIHIAFACVILGIPIATTLAGLAIRFLSNRRSE